ncbi:hypothetical protein ACQ4PT_006238 [Festuca glaucescens]
MATGGAVHTIKPSTTPTTMQWPDLPGDLLGTVYSRLTGPLDRLRFAAACRSWRAAAIASRHLAPPSLPWFIYNNYYTEKHRLYCPEYASVLRIPLLTKVSPKKFVGCHDGGWVAATGDNKQIRILNISGTEIELSPKQRTVAFCEYHLSPPSVIRKIIFSQPPTSDNCILAATSNSCGIALCRVGCPEGGWTTNGLPRENLIDIAFSS